METTTSYSATGSGGMNTTRLLTAVAGIIVTFIVLYLGFIFLRDTQANGTPKLLVTIVAIIWGVGGVAALFFVANMLVESFSTKWTTRIQPYIFIGPAVILLAWYLAAPTIRTFALSLYTTEGGVTRFAGLENYQAVFTQRIMIEAWTNNLMCWLVYNP
ncbi:MAG: hypothetical protein R3E39_16545 [Anaerolineae bacterium]